MGERDRFTWRVKGHGQPGTDGEGDNGKGDRSRGEMYRNISWGSVLEKLV